MNKIYKIPNIKTNQPTIKFPGVAPSIKRHTSKKRATTEQGLKRLRSRSRIEVPQSRRPFSGCPPTALLGTNKRAFLAEHST